jgi:poly(hydroxyalkanoate) granule-associated protein
MATTPKDEAATGPGSMVEAVAASAQQIWQAGLGAFAKAQQDGGAMFDKLVRDGAELHALTRHLSGDKFPAVTGTIGRLAESVGRQASGSWDKIEKLFEDRVARSLHNLGVPSREDMEALRREIDALKAAMPGPTPPRATAAKSATKAATKTPTKAATKPVTKAAARRTTSTSAAGTAPKRPSRAAGARS